MFRVDAAQNPFDVGLDEGPCTLVLGLFLTPDHLGPFETLQLSDRGLRGEGIELFEPQDVDIVDAAGVTLFQQVVIDLARTHHDALDLVICQQFGVGIAFLGVIPEHPVEAGAGGEILGLADGQLVACLLYTSPSPRDS